jgi:hypothetical protein
MDTDIMKLSEFLFLHDYEKALKEETKESEIKNREFISLVPLVLRQAENTHPKVRDNLDVDGTFAVIIPSWSANKLSFVEAINYFESVQQILVDTTYSTVDLTGLIKDLEGYQGFWIKIS